MASTQTPAKVKRETRGTKAIKKTKSPATNLKKSPGKKRGSTFEEPGAIEGRGVVYVKHIPHGFYEQQMKEYFQQFGKVTRLRLSRSKKTGNSKGYAYVEFESEDVAKIAADSMSDYLMFRQRLMCKVIDPATLHPSTFKGCHRPFSHPKSSAIARERHNRPITPSQQTDRAKRLQRKNAKQLAAFKELGIDYTMNVAEDKLATKSTKLEKDIKVVPSKAEKRTKDTSKKPTKRIKIA